MKKVLALVALLVPVALAAAAGTITAPNVMLDVGAGPQTFDITISGPASLPGLNLNLQIGDGALPAYVAGPKIVGADITGAGTLLAGANNGPTTLVISEQMYYIGTVTPNAGQRVLVAGGETQVLGRVTIDPASSPVGSVWPLLLTSLNGMSDYADDQGVDFPDTLVDGSITITPEPASALLLLAAVPFLRRRPA